MLPHWIRHLLIRRRYFHSRSGGGFRCERYAVEERRIELRRRTLKSGLIAFNRAGGISCTVRNLSDQGANLEVASPIGIPNEFTLAIDADHVQRQCRVIWRTNSRIGVRFAPH